MMALTNASIPGVWTVVAVSAGAVVAVVLVAAVAAAAAVVAAADVLAEVWMLAELPKMLIAEAGFEVEELDELVVIACR
jgi:hypothetical protein